MVPVNVRFWSKVAVDSEESCWVWRGTTNRSGYGFFKVKAGEQRLAHRVSWEFRNGPIPAGLCVCHRCDNPPCVNPAHLFLGTQGDNLADMRAKGRQGHGTIGRPGTPGEDHGSAKMTDEKVREIRSRYALGGITQVALASEFSIDQKQVSNIIRRVNWRHVAMLLVAIVGLPLAGCDAATPEEAARAAVTEAPCGYHGGRYVATLGAAIAGPADCLYRPTVEDVILPDDESAIACSTSERQDFRLAIDPRVQLTEVINCTWSANGDHADCTLSENADEGQATCSAGFALTYDRVRVVAW